MFRNQYDGDITIWSPQGRLHQVEYAMEASKQGSACVGIKSKSHAVLVALKKSTGELASTFRKLYRIDDHMGVAIAGLTSDARVMCNFMRVECMRQRMVFDRRLPVLRIVNALADKAQVNTQKYGGRPYGVGLLVVGADEMGAHLYECNPSGNFYDYRAMAIGARSQSAKTYLEKHVDAFEGCDLETLVVHALRALRDTLQQDQDLTAANVAIGTVGLDPATGKLEKFALLDGDALQQYLDKLGASDETMGPSLRRARAAGGASSGGASSGAPPADDAGDSMQTD